MKFFAVFAAVLALAAGAPWSWTLNELSLAIQNPETNPEFLPYLEHALNQMMDDIYAGKPVTPVSIIMPTVTSWTLNELSLALQDSNTDPGLVPYLEAALNEMMHALYSGQTMESIPVVVPVGLKPVPVEASVEPVVPVLPTPVIPSPVPVTPLEPESPAAPVSSSPLVQIVVNINQQQQVTDITGTPVLDEIEPTPVIVVDEAENVINPVDVIAINPPQVNPVPVNPVDVVAISPPQVNPVPVNPVDVVAISPPQINPINVIAVSPQ